MLFSKQLKNPIKNNKMLEDEKKTFKKGKKNKKTRVNSVNLS
jgi:hypothetical protein